MAKDKKILFSTVEEATKVIGKHRNKHGVIKVKGDKKKTKELKEYCSHHKLNKKGKYEATIVQTSNGHCRCTQCGADLDVNKLTTGDIKGATDVKKSQYNAAIFLVTQAAKKAGNHKYDDAYITLVGAKKAMKYADRAMINVNDIFAKKAHDDDKKKNKDGVNKNGGSLSSWMTR